MSSGTIARPTLRDTVKYSGGNADCNQVKRALGYLNLAYFTVASNQIGGAVADVAVTLPIATKFIMLVGASKLSDSCFMHLLPLGKQYGGSNNITPVGNENWFPFCQQTSTLTKIGLYYRFAKELPPVIYFDLGNESGTQNFNTFIVGDDIDELGSMFAAVG